MGHFHNRFLIFCLGISTKRLWKSGETRVEICGNALKTLCGKRLAFPPQRVVAFCFDWFSKKLYVPPRVEGHVF